MMAYITLSYYKTDYLGVDPSDDTALTRAIARASDDVDMQTGYGIVLADLDAAQLAMVQKATAAQAEFYVQNGDTYNSGEQAGSENIGAYGRTVGYQQRKSPVSLCPRARAYLEQSGLMYRGIRVLGPSASWAGDDE